MLPCRRLSCQRVGVVRQHDDTSSPPPRPVGHAVSDDQQQWLVAREQVSDVVVRVALAQDAHDWAMLEDCFEPDAVYDIPGGGRLVGAAAIVERSRRALEALDTSQHLIGSILVVVDATGASSTSYFQAQHVRAGLADGELYVIAGTYQDRFTQRTGAWRISERVQSYTWRQGNREVVLRR